MDYPLPPWLSPQASQGWGGLALDAAKSRANVQMHRDQMAQQSAQFAIEAQQKSQQAAQEAQANQDALNYNHLMEQQKIAIDQAYKQQQASMEQGRLEVEQGRFTAATQQAAAQHTGMTNYQNSQVPKEKGGEGLTEPQARLKYLVPIMTPDAAARDAVDTIPFDIGNPIPIPGHPDLDAIHTSRNSIQLVPKPPGAITNAPTVINVPGPNGESLGNFIQLPNQKPIFSKAEKMTESEKEEAELNKKAAGGKGSQYKSADDVRAAYKAKKLTSEQAAKILKDQFGFE